MQYIAVAIATSFPDILVKKKGFEVISVSFHECMVVVGGVRFGVEISRHLKSKRYGTYSESPLVSAAGGGGGAWECLLARYTTKKLL